mgnify:CR=1 FL=1|tara:strand:- start:601 stop:879 length:279 start_codon:yes stop_codon:yes gene_type:complete
MVSERENELAKAIEQELYEHIGPLLFGEKLYAALGFSSYQAFRQASSRNTLPVEIFSLEKRRGKFALSRDVARWLAKKRYQIAKETEQDTMA